MQANFHDLALQQLRDRVKDSDKVLDVGGWHSPWNRANAIIDIMPYQTRNQGGAMWKEVWPTEHFSEDTFHQQDICSGERFPFADKEFDFVPFKPAMLHAYRKFHFRKPLLKKMNPKYSSVGFFWESTFQFEQRILIERDEVQQNLVDFKHRYRNVNDIFVRKYSWLGQRL